MLETQDQPGSRVGFNTGILGRHTHAVHHRRILFFTFSVQAASLHLRWWSHIPLHPCKDPGKSSFFPFFLNLSHHFYFLHGSPAFLCLLFDSALTFSCADSCHCPVTSSLHCSHRCGHKWRWHWYIQSLAGSSVVTTHHAQAQWLPSRHDTAPSQGIPVCLSTHGLPKRFASLWFRC